MKERRMNTEQLQSGVLAMLIRGVVDKYGSSEGDAHLEAFHGEGQFWRLVLTYDKEQVDVTRPRVLEYESIQEVLLRLVRENPPLAWHHEEEPRRWVYLSGVVVRIDLAALGMARKP